MYTKSEAKQIIREFLNGGGQPRKVLEVQRQGYEFKHSEYVYFNGVKLWKKNRYSNWPHRDKVTLTNV